MSTEETKKCPDCLAEIPKEAKKCSHCGKKQKQPVTKFRTGIIATLLFVIFIPAFMGGNTNSSTPTAQTQVTPTDMQAFIISQNYVMNILKSPKTAEFPSRDFRHNLVEGETHVINSYVDSQNGFGALIRSDWTVSMTFNGGDWADGNNWTLERLVFDGEEVYLRSDITE